MAPGIFRMNYRLFITHTELLSYKHTLVITEVQLATSMSSGKPYIATSSVRKISLVKIMLAGAA